METSKAEKLILEHGWNYIRLQPSDDIFFVTSSVFKDYERGTITDHQIRELGFSRDVIMNLSEHEFNVLKLL